MMGEYIDEPIHRLVEKIKNVTPLGFWFIFLPTAGKIVPRWGWNLSV